MSSHGRWLIFIVLLTAFCLWVALPENAKGVQSDSPECDRIQEEGIVNERGFLIDTGDVKCTEDLIVDLNNDRMPDFVLGIRQSLGLDLVGGLRVLLEADAPAGTFDEEALSQAANNVGRRVNALGLSEATVQVQGANRILVEIPGLRDRDQAIGTIQQTALLEFVDFGGLREFASGYSGQFILTDRQVDIHGRPVAEEGAAYGSVSNPLLHPTTNEPFRTVMTGEGLQSAVARFAQTSQTAPPQWFIEFEVKPEFTEIFGSFTGSRIGEPMAIVLDGQVLSAPIIQSQLDTGGVITGQFSEEEAKTLALQLRSGALPIPLVVVGDEEVGATLGQESVNLSVRAGVLGVIVVLAFMLIYYRVPGISADIALGVFILINLALFKLIPITLTLPAITGFLISIGTAVDGNILIFERIKEEIRAGKNLDEALVAGFDRAWTSIRDSNLSTIIIAGVLFLFGQTPGASVVSGFAITLALGLVINLFTAVIVTRTFLHVIVGVAHDTLAERKWLLGV